MPCPNVSLAKAAEQLGICVGSAKSLALKGVLPATQAMKGAQWLVPIEALTSEAVRIGCSKSSRGDQRITRTINTIGSSSFQGSDRERHYETHCARLLRNRNRCPENGSAPSTWIPRSQAVKAQQNAHRAAGQIHRVPGIRAIMRSLSAPIAPAAGRAR